MFSQLILPILFDSSNSLKIIRKIIWFYKFWNSINNWDLKILYKKLKKLIKKIEWNNMNYKIKKVKKIIEWNEIMTMSGQNIRH